MQQGYNVGYIKPLGTIPIKKGPDVYDEDAVFIKAALGLSDSVNYPRLKCLSRDFLASTTDLPLQLVRQRYHLRRRLQTSLPAGSEQYPLLPC